MKNDVSHHVILLNLIFAQFCRIFPGKTGFRIRKTGYPIQKFICFKTYFGQGEYYLKFSAKSVKKHSEIRVFPDFRKIWISNENREVPDNINCKSVNCGIPNNIDMPLTLFQVDLFNKRKSKIVTEPYFKIEKTKYHFCFYFVFTSNIKAGDRKGYN